MMLIHLLSTCSTYSHLSSLFSTFFTFFLHQQKLHALLSTSFFSMISPAKYGCLVAFHFREVVTQLPEVHFWALPPTSITSCTLEVIEMFPDVRNKQSAHLLMTPGPPSNRFPIHPDHQPPPGSHQISHPPHP